MNMENMDLGDDNEEFIFHQGKKRIYDVKIQHITEDKKQYIEYDEDERLKWTTSTTTTTNKKDLSLDMNIIYDQGNYGSCTANACAWSYQYIRRDFRPSRFFIYYNERWLDLLEGDNSVKIDDGSTLEQGMKSLKRFGVVREGVYPYIPRNFWKRPNQNLYQAARNNRILEFYHVPQDIENMKRCIDSGYPFVFGIYVYTSYESTYTEQTGILRYPNRRLETLLGGHAIVAVGYDDEKQYIKFANSYGRGWGDNGYGYIPYSYILDSTLTDDLWVIKRMYQKPNRRRIKQINSKKKIIIIHKK